MDVGLELPAISTYADATYMGELVYGSGRDWPYARFMAQYRKANCIGVAKSDSWADTTWQERELTMLRYNGRGQYRLYPGEYFQVLRELQRLWQEKGGEPEFYERYYLPRWEELTQLDQSRSPALK
jgi:hypothetical protein